MKITLIQFHLKTFMNIPYILGKMLLFYPNERCNLFVHMTRESHTHYEPTLVEELFTNMPSSSTIRPILMKNDNIYIYIFIY